MLDKSVLILLGLTRSSLAVIQKKISGQGTKTLVTSDEERKDIIEIVNLLKNLIYW